MFKIEPSRYKEYLYKAVKNSFLKMATMTRGGHFEYHKFKAHIEIFQLGTVEK